MTAQLTYQIIMTLPPEERELLFDMLKPQMKKFDLNELLSVDKKKSIDKHEMMKLLIKTVFSKQKNN